MPDFGTCRGCGSDLVEVTGGPRSYTATDKNGVTVVVPDAMEKSYARFNPATPFLACPEAGLTYAGHRGTHYVFSRYGDPHAR